MNIERIKTKMYREIFLFAIPSVIAMLLTTLSTLVDGMFVGRFVSGEALAAVQLGLPLLYFYLGIAIMIGVGGVSIAGKYLGMKKYKDANKVYVQTIFITAVVVCLLSILISFLFPVILPILNIKQSLVEYVMDYYKIMIFSYIFNMTFIVLGMFIRAIGKPNYFMIISLILNVINIGLDYLFILQFSWGVKGAALASLISGFIGFILAYFMLEKFSLFKIVKVKFDKVLAKKMILNGSSELIGQWSMMITTLLFNVVVMYKVGSDGITATTIAGYSGYIFSMIIVGIGQGISPMVSYVYGSGDILLCKQLRSKANKIVFSVGFVMMLFIWIFAYDYISCFTKDKMIINVVENGIKIYTVGFLFAGFNIIASFVYTALGMAKQSALISASRGLIVITILILVLPFLFGLDGVWFIFPLTEIITVFLTFKLIFSEKLTLDKLNLE